MPTDNLTHPSVFPISTKEVQSQKRLLALFYKYVLRTFLHNNEEVLKNLHIHSHA